MYATQLLQLSHSDGSSGCTCHLLTKSGSLSNARASATASKPAAMHCATLSADFTPPRYVKGRDTASRIFFEYSQKYSSRKSIEGADLAVAPIAIPLRDHLPRTRYIASRFILLPNMNQPDSTLRPPDNTNMSAPAASSNLAVTIASSTLAPRRLPSETLILASTAISCPTRCLTAARTLVGKRARFSALPP